MLEEATKKPEAQPEGRIQKDQFVIPNMGPHKGMRHKVSHVHSDGSFNIVPWDIHPSKIKYRLGAAKATHDQVEVIKEDFKNWNVKFEPGEHAKVIHGDHVGKRGKVIEKHNDGESYTIQHTDGTKLQHHISTLSEAAPNHPIPDVVRAHLPIAMQKEYDAEQAKKKDKKKVIDESKNTPSVKEYHEGGKHVGWKAMNKHGKTKFFRLEGKAAAHKHAGLEMNEGYRIKTTSADGEVFHSKVHATKAAVTSAHWNAIQKNKKQPASRQAKKIEVVSEQQINELSKKTLGHYVKMAVSDKERIDNDSKVMSQVGHDAQKDGDKEGAHRFFMKAGNLVHKSSKRRRGIHTAINKLVSEGRPAKNSDDSQEHVVMQLRKNISMNGSKPIKFADGESHVVASGHAGKVLDHYNDIKHPKHKEAFQAHIGSSHRNFSDWIGGKKFEYIKEDTSIDSREVNNDEIFGSERLQESRLLRTVKSLAHRKALVERNERREKFRRQIREIIASV